jgi:hypothetical protein
MSKPLDDLARSIIESGKCCMCNEPLPNPNTKQQVACNDCTEYAFESVGFPRKGASDGPSDDGSGVSGD